MKGIQCLSNEGPSPFPNDYIAKKTLYLKIFLSWIITGPILNFGTTHPSLMEITICSNKGPRPTPRRDNGKIIAKIYWRHLTIFYSRTTESISTKLGTIHPLVKGIQVCSNGGKSLFSRGDNYDFKPTCFYNHSFARDYLLLGNGSHVSDVAHGPLV